MIINISIHETPPEIYDAIQVEEKSPSGQNEGITFWKVLKLEKVEITFFKSHEVD